MINTCIFDLDGTLVDSLQDLANTVNQVLINNGKQPHPLSAYNHFVGDGVEMLLQRAFDTTKITSDIRKQFQDGYRIQCLETTKPYAGIMELIKALKNKDIHLAVVTNKPHEIANEIVKSLFPDTFTYVYGNQEQYPKKPNPTAVHLVVSGFQVETKNCVFIGDSDVDIVTGKNAKMRTIGVAWGFRGREELLAQGADVVVKEAKEIEEIIDDWNK